MPTPTTVLVTGGCRRPVIHVRDAGAALCHALRADLPNPIDNLVGQTASVLDIVAALRSAHPETQVHFTEQDVRTHVSFAADPVALISTGWQPRVSLAAGTSELLAHFQNIRCSLPTMPDVENV